MINLLLPEVSHEVVECFRMDVLTNLHQDEPISKPDLLHDHEDILPLGGPGAAEEDMGTGGTEKWIFCILFLEILIRFYLEAIVIILKHKKMLVQVSTTRYQNQRKK